MSIELIVWIAIAIITLVAELVTYSLVSIWFTGAAIISMIAYWIGLGFIWQTIIFIVFSALFIYWTRPLIQKLRNKETDTTNVPTAILDKVGIVTTEINNLEGTGEVKVGGKFWTARLMDDNDTHIVKVGKRVRVVLIDGVKLRVIEIDLDNPPEE